MPVDANIDRAMTQAETITDLPLEKDSVKVHIVNVLDEDASIDASSDMLNPDRLDSINKAEEILKSHGIAVETDRVAGDISTMIIKLADELNADGIFIGGVKRSPTGKAIFGSTAQTVILNAGRPVTITIQSS